LPRLRSNKRLDRYKVSKVSWQESAVEETGTRKISFKLLAGDQKTFL
jgi:hypothetical protein